MTVFFFNLSCPRALPALHVLVFVHSAKDIGCFSFLSWSIKAHSVWLKIFLAANICRDIGSEDIVADASCFIGKMENDPIDFYAKYFLPRQDFADFTFVLRVIAIDTGTYRRMDGPLFLLVLLFLGQVFYYYYYYFSLLMHLNMFYPIPTPTQPGIDPWWFLWRGRCLTTEPSVLAESSLISMHLVLQNSETIQGWSLLLFFFSLFFWPHWLQMVSTFSFAVWMWEKQYPPSMILILHTPDTVYHQSIQLNIHVAWSE